MRASWALAEHGLVPSVQAARMTYASSPESLHGAVAAGLLGCGSVILGSSSDTATFLQEIVAAADADAGPALAKAALDAVRRLRAAGQPMPGIGHPLHREADPRAEALIALADRLGVSGSYTSAVHAVVAAVPEVCGHRLPLNVSGAIPAVLLDVDFPAAAMKGVPLIGRTMSLVAHLLEEKENPIGFGLAAVAEAAASPG